MTDEKDVWQLTEDPPDYAKETASLYHWSTNFDPGKGPFTLFLDLIGWSDENIGEPLYSLKDVRLGYLELHYLADALKEYTENPHSVAAFVDELMEAESR